MYLMASTLPFAAWFAARLDLNTSAVKVSGLPPPSTKLRTFSARYCGELQAMGCGLPTAQNGGAWEGRGQAEGGTRPDLSSSTGTSNAAPSRCDCSRPSSARRALMRSCSSSWSPLKSVTVASSS